MNSSFDLGNLRGVFLSEYTVRLSSTRFHFSEESGLKYIIETNYDVEIFPDRDGKVAPTGRDFSDMLERRLIRVDKKNSEYEFLFEGDVGFKLVDDGSGWDNAFILRVSHEGAIGSPPDVYLFD